MSQWWTVSTWFKLACWFASSLQKEDKRCQYYLPTVEAQFSIHKHNIARVPERLEYKETGSP